MDGNGLTALQRFARHGEDMGGIVTLLIRTGADPNQKDPRGDAPLHAAIKEGGSNGHAAVVKALLQGGADPCVQDAQGATPYQMSSGMQRIQRALARAEGDNLVCDKSRMVYDEGAGSGDVSKRTDRGQEGRTGERRPGEATAALKPFGPNWIIVENQPCQKWNPNPIPGETYTWSGACVNGKVSGAGRGVWHLPNNRGQQVYEGSIREGKKHGQGTLTYENGNRYEGEYRNGKKHGQGTYVWAASGNRYEGEWAYGRAHGYGTTTWANGDHYEGEFREGKRHGHGTYTWANGDRYEGEWRNDKRVD